MTKRKINYSEGDCISVPLLNREFARGVIARMDGRGCIFGYFFPPSIEDSHNVKIDDFLSPGNNILLARVGDLGLLNSEWKVIGRIPDFRREVWKLPAGLRWDEGDSEGVECIFDEDTLETISEKPISIVGLDLTKELKDGLMGYGFLEIRLTKLLSKLAVGL